MRTWHGWSLVLLALTAACLQGCATLQQIAALERVRFDLDRVSDVRIAGIALDGRDSWSDLSLTEGSRLARAVADRAVPLQLVVHVRGENPAENRVTARLVDMDWTFWIEERKTVSGKLEGNYLFPPGETVDVPLGVEMDLTEFFDGGARELFDLALALAGVGSKEVRLEALPTVQTSLGPIRYPAPIVMRRVIGPR